MIQYCLEAFKLETFLATSRTTFVNFLRPGITHGRIGSVSLSFRPSRYDISTTDLFLLRLIFTALFHLLNDGSCNLECLDTGWYPSIYHSVSDGLPAGEAVSDFAPREYEIELAIVRDGMIAEHAFLVSIMGYKDTYL
jgi:hypothetical protein